MIDRPACYRDVGRAAMATMHLMDVTIRDGKRKEITKTYLLLLAETS